MDFQNEMHQIFMQIAQGTLEPADWEIWWHSHTDALKKQLSPGDILRIMPAAWQPTYHWMNITQNGIAYYFSYHGRPVKVSDYYEQKSQVDALRQHQDALTGFHERTAPIRKPWEDYLSTHPVQTIDFAWQDLLGTPAKQQIAPTFSYKAIRTTEQRQESLEALHLRLTENIQAKIAPLAKAYGMKKFDYKTFVREKNGLVCCIKFMGYFRGGGYESLRYYLCPIYALDSGALGLPGHIEMGENAQKMRKGWSVIQHNAQAIDADMVEKINQKFDDILTFLAEDVLPEWQKIDSLETYFAKERQNYLQATAKGPVNPQTGRPMWDINFEDDSDPWRANDYLFGVWDLLSGREDDGYARLSACLAHHADFMAEHLRQHPEAYNNRLDPQAVLYHNAALFAQTQHITDTPSRRQAITQTYEDVTRFMRYYHSLVKREKR